jgi:hypothetical protein
MMAGPDFLPTYDPGHVPDTMIVDLPGGEQMELPAGGGLPRGSTDAPRGKDPTIFVYGVLWYQDPTLGQTHVLKWCFFEPTKENKEPLRCNADLIDADKALETR